MTAISSYELINLLQLICTKWLHRFKSPGPIYKLPPAIGYKDHDISRYRNPGYTMSPRLGGGFGRPTMGPGPTYQVRGFTEHGKESPPAYTLTGRYKPLEPFVGPGPGNYSPESVPRMKESRPPAWTMSPRSHIQHESIGPGPLAYSLPSMLGPKVPNKYANGAFTMSPRLEYILKNGGPGPATYPGADLNVYKYKNPKYTMSPRWNAIMDKVGSPGPAAYALGSRTIPGKTAPKYSMGIQYGEIYTPYITPQDAIPCDT